MGLEEEKISSEIIIRNFDLQENENLNLEDMKKMLAEKISELMSSNIAKLFSILYRIDVEEEKAMNALSKSNAADALADCIIERQIEKVKTRIHYRKENNKK